MLSVHSCPVGRLGGRDTGGMNVYIREIARELGKRGHRVKEVWLWASEKPNHVTDITDTFDIKLAALRCHKSQMGQTPFPQSDPGEWLRERHRKLAEGQDFELAEAFHRVEIFW